MTKKLLCVIILHRSFWLWKEKGNGREERDETLYTLNRDFRTDRPNQKWVTDVSYIMTGQGFLYYPSSGTCTIWALSVIVLSQGRRWIWFWIRSGERRKKKRLLMDSHSTVINGFNTLQRSISTWHKRITFPRPCQDVETRLKMLWLKISSAFS